jgi:ribosome-binding factor A
MPEPRRSDRIAGQLQSVLSTVLLEGVRDPRVRPITITHVRVSDDLRLARVNFTPLGGDGDPASILAGLKAASGYLRREVGLRLNLKYLPELVFHVDERVGKAMRVSQLLDAMSARAAEGAPAADAEPEEQG